MHIGFIFAMEEEALALEKAFLQNLKIINNLPFKALELNNQEVKVTGIISGIGKVFAASAVTVLIEKYNVDAVVNIGAAGGVNCKVGDIVISTEAAYHDVDVTAFGYQKGAIPKQPLIFKSQEKYLQLDKLEEIIEDKSSCYKGLVATGDQFINDINLVNSIKKQFSNVKAIEMEAAAIAQVCYNYNKDFILVKKISDLADKEAGTSFKEEIINFDEKISKLIKGLVNI